MKWYPAISRDGAVVVRGEGGESVVKDGQGRSITLSNSRWHPTRVLSFSSGFSILFLEQRTGTRRHSTGDRQDAPTAGPADDRMTGWILLDDYRLGAATEGLGDSWDATDFREAITKAFESEALRLLAPSGQCESPGQAMRPGERDVVQRLLARLQLRSTLTTRPISGFRAQGDITPATIFTGGRAFETYAKGLATPNFIPPELARSLGVTQIRHIPLDESLREVAHVCWTSTSDCYVFLVMNYRKMKRRLGFLLHPHGRVVFGEDFSEKAIAFLERSLAALYLSLVSSNAQASGPLLRTPERGGLLLAGRKNFGHGIWEELQTIEWALQNRPAWTELPYFYVHKEGGAALYRPLEQLYPELEGRFVYRDTMLDIVEHSLTHGVQLFKGRGYFAMRATRERFISLARRHGESHSITPNSEQLLRQSPVVVFGLRLSNRHPVDYLGFYVRLAKALLARFGQLSVIFDGMNVDPDTGRPAAAVINANAANDGEHEIRSERDFVRRFEAALSDSPIQVQSCVGLTIRDNLSWLSYADFFVSPNGGGLAKLRWALDIPGYVLSARINFKNCILLNVYGDNTQTEEPFTPIYMNKPSEVEDVPPQPPRLERVRPRGVPYPENFVVDERSVIPRICELIGLTLEQKQRTQARQASTN